MNILRQQKEDFFNIFSRIRHRNFSGDTGLVIKNSFYQFLTNIASKVGGFVITIILARMLMPELFGLYNLVLSVILIFGGITDLGIASALMKFLSREIEKRNFKRAKAYFNYLRRFKIIIACLAIVALLISSYYLSYVFYKKPIFLGLLAGSLYILFYSVLSWFQSLLQALNDFRGTFLGETFFQVARVILVPVAVLLTVKSFLSSDMILFFIFLALSSAYLVSIVLLFIFRINKIKLREVKKSSLPQTQKKNVNIFLTATAATAFSGMFFSYIDRIMLGHFVSAEFIGYYTAAFSLITAVTALAGFGAVFLPVFSKMDDSKIHVGLEKSIRNVSMLSGVIFLLILVLSEWIIKIAYGSAYAPSINVLRILSPLIFLLPLISIYSSYFLSRGRPWLMSNFLFAATLLNIILNYVFITLLLPYGGLIAVYGSGAATIISQFLYLLALFVFSKIK